MQIVFLALSLYSVLANGLQITLPAGSALKSKARPVAPDLVSFSIEQDRWEEWVGSTSRNEFFYNALVNLRELAGRPPTIRVGGRSQDVTHLKTNMQGSEVLFANSTPSVPYPEAVYMRVGPSFFLSAKFLPEDTRVIHGLNFASADDLRGLFHLAAIANAFTAPSIKNARVTLEAIEVGNEPDRYGRLDARMPTYDGTQYVKEWNTWAGNVLAVKQLYPEFLFSYWGASLSVNSSHDPTGWTPEALFGQGLLDSPAGKRLKTVSQHHYSIDGCAEGPTDILNLMKKANVRKSLEPFKSSLKATQEKGLEYVLGEVGSVSCHGATGVSDTAGAALWALDYALHSASMGISRVFFHQGIGYKSNFLQPVFLNRSPIDGSDLPSPLSPHINPQYYAAIIAAEAIGSSNGSVEILELSIEDNRVSAYVFLKGGLPTRAVLINSQPYFASESGDGVFQTRPFVRVSLEIEGMPEDAQFMMKRLSIQYTDATAGLTWGGFTFETDDAFPSGEEEIECIDFGEEFELYATEAVLLYLQEVEGAET
ncbi:hypothetical protein DFP72DRAFT_248807 [Ephemerocybe angulata]|uniref:Beta-glucuronidase C-terminal domain-containing protein n=1 Tax=Ephemerocybe angulata TaxID=980116 RepID=A0A8H6I490_9AGAR|nr:hypothetical protein DFP72DRAFT_248807 [Tulosesus angulatus]